MRYQTDEDETLPILWSLRSAVELHNSRRSDSNMSSIAPEDRPFIFRVNDNGTGPVLLIQVCQERGWKEYDGTKSGDSAWSVPADEYWNLWWKSTGFSLSHYKQQKIWQFNNHIPSGSALCRKDNLWRYLKCMKNIFGTSLFGFSPDSYNLPLEYTKLAAECSHDTDVGEKSIWICKPVGQSQGKGISLISQIGELVYDTNIVVQRYVKNPMLIGGYKYDLRLYVLVPSFHPLTIYVYREGLTRFSTDKYSLNNLDNHFAHLTNSSINKLGPNYSETKEKIGLGCKWTLQQLRQHIRQAGVNDWLLWQKISVLVSLTLASQCTGIPSTSNCFELYGFDILVDSDLKPWLLEVNLSPALGNDCDVDNRVKRPLLHDMFDLLGLPMCNTGLSLFRMACRSASGPRFGDGRPTALAAAATEKWKSKRKTNNNNAAANNNNNNVVNNINASKKDCTAPLTSTAQSQSSARQSTLYGPGKQRGATTAQRGHRRPVQLSVFVAGVGQRSGLEQARRFGGRLGPGIPVRAVASAIAPDRRPAVAAAAVRPQACVVVAVRDGHGPRHHQDHSRVPEVLQEGGQVLRGSVRCAGRRAQRQTQRPIPGRDDDVAATPLKDFILIVIR
ncbi:unnamed protein product [Macrosiphum euphorbiae]|uniref:Tubulin polyglutamylase TTLL2 n=1 Tax=Macrosiphum euphorbiae TaxID=13131 RepID=A0AAV0W564_9HEMI|nr:unnamed protein product [Macrosiphum euphorbiae]